MEGDVVVMLGYPTLTWQLFESLEGSGYKHAASGSLFHNSFNDAEKLFAGNQDIMKNKVLHDLKNNKCVFRRHFID